MNAFNPTEFDQPRTTMFVDKTFEGANAICWKNDSRSKCTFDGMEKTRLLSSPWYRHEELSTTYYDLGESYYDMNGNYVPA